MAERELRRMNRMELIEIIYALKQHEEELEQQNANLRRQLADRTLRLEPGWFHRRGRFVAEPGI